MRHVPRQVRTIAVSLTAVAAGCGMPSRQPSVVVRDSAGIRIIETLRPVWASQSPWTVSDAPVLTIGTLDGPPHEEFFGIAGVARLGDGRIAVADRGAGEIRFFGPDGRLLGTAGRKGYGPGEFQTIYSLSVIEGDSLLVSDGRLYRYSIFDPAGDFVRVFRTDLAGDEIAWPVALLGDRTLLVASGRFMGGQRVSGIQRDSAFFLLADLQGAVLDTFGRFAVDERYVRISEGGLRTTIGRPFARVTRVATGAGRLFVATSDAYRIDVYGRGRRLERILRIPLQPRAVTEADIRRYVESRQQRPDGPRRRAEMRLLRDIPFPDVFPAYADLLVDSEGYLWAQEYRRPGERATRWLVYDPEGRWLGTLEGPDGFRVHQIDGDHLLGVHTDELGVEQVRMYRLHRS